MTAPFPEGPRRVFRAAASTFVPEAASLDEAGWTEVERIVARALEARPEAIRRRAAAFLRFLELAPVARWGLPFTRLSPERRARFLHALERSPVLLLRRGVWGVRTLAFMGWYCRPEAHEAIGYRGRAGGWSMRGGATPVIPLAPPAIVVERP